MSEASVDSYKFHLPCLSSGNSFVQNFHESLRCDHGNGSWAVHSSGSRKNSWEKIFVPLRLTLFIKSFPLAYCREKYVFQ